MAAHAVIGSSLPAHDEYARQVLYRIVRNYQRAHGDQDIIGHCKTPLVLVDYRPAGASLDDFRRRYAFVHQNKATYCLGGFTENTLAHVFANN